MDVSEVSATERESKDPESKDPDKVSLPCWFREFYPKLCPGAS